MQRNGLEQGQFTGDEFLDSPIAFENGTVVALVHTEYPGGVYNLTGPSAPECAGLAPDGSGNAKNYPYCWTVRPIPGTSVAPCVTCMCCARKVWARYHCELASTTAALAGDHRPRYFT